MDRHLVNRGESNLICDGCGRQISHVFAHGYVEADITIIDRFNRTVRVKRRFCTKYGDCLGNARATWAERLADPAAYIKRRDKMTALWNRMTRQPCKTAR